MLVATWTAFIAYSLAALALGWRSRARGRAEAEFWDAGRDLDAWSVGVSISAGFMSVSWSCVYAVQLFYWYGLGAAWLITIPWLLALLGIHWLAGRYRGLSAFSQPEMVGNRFGVGPRRAVAVALAFVFLVWGGAEIYVAANLLAPAMGVARGLLIVLIGVVVAGYSLLGGFRAVVSTDKLQYGIVAMYVAAMAWLSVIGLRSTEAWAASGEGTGSAWAALWQLPLTGARTDVSWTHLLAPGAATILLTSLAYLPGWLFETDLWLRVQAARDAGQARRGVMIAGVNGLLFVGLLPAFIGVAALAIFPMQGGQFPAGIGAEGDAIFAALVASFAPGWLAVLVSLGLVAAAMSTIDTCINVMALSIGYDLRGQRSGATEDRFSRRVVAGSVVAACLFAHYTESLWDIFYLSSGVLTAAVAFPVAAVFLPWANSRAVLWSSVAGLSGTVLAYFAETRGVLDAVSPPALSDSGLGFVLWGAAAALAAAAAGIWSSPTRAS